MRSALRAVVEFAKTRVRTFSCKLNISSRTFATANNKLATRFKQIQSKAQIITKMQSIRMSDKDTVIFATKTNHETPSKYDPPPALASEERRGVMLPNGEINWTCPCLGGLPYGPCGYEFRQFFSCLPQFDKKKEEQSTEQDDSKKAEECFPKFAAMKECMSQFPKLYPPDEGEDELLKGAGSSTDSKNSPPTSSDNKEAA